MSNTLYDITRQAFLTGALNWIGGDTFGVALVDTTQYTVEPSSDQYLSVIPSGAIVAQQDMTNPTASGGTASADPVTIDGVTGNVGAIVIYQDTGDASTDQLIAYIDTGSGLPSTFDNQTMSLMWDSSSDSGIFEL